jgi:Fe-S cluster assembly protein SufB
MLDIRLKAYAKFLEIPNPAWGPDLSFINFNDYQYYSSPIDKEPNTWEDIPEKIKDTFNKLGVGAQEARFFSGVNNQYDSESIYHELEQELEQKKVIFTNIETAMKTHPDLVKKYFGKLVDYADNKYAALNTAV